MGNVLHYYMNYMYPMLQARNSCNNVYPSNMICLV